MPLSASERVNLLKEITHRLEGEEFPLLDLTLEQFGLPTSEIWNGSKEGYILQHVKGANDAIVAELARHVGIDIGREAAGDGKVDPPFWQAGYFRLFLSHLATHRGFTAEIQEQLSYFGISAFVAHNDIEPTTEWQTQIETALATCDGLVALLHPDFHASKWTDQEIGYVMGRDLPTYAVRFGEDPYGFIGRFQAFNGNGKSAAAIATELFHALRQNKQTARKMADVLITLFEKSGSFSSAKERIGYLEDMEHWDSSYAGRLESAVKNNGQISDSWGVPERVAALLRERIT